PALRVIPRRQPPSVVLQLGLEPLDRLFSPARQLLAIKLTGVDPLSAAGQGPGAGGVVEKFKFCIARKSLIRGDCSSEKARGSNVSPFFVTDPRIRVRLGSVRRHGFTPEHRWQPTIELGPQTAPFQPSRRWIGPIATPRAQFVPAFQFEQSLRVLALF